MQLMPAAIEPMAKPTPIPPGAQPANPGVWINQRLVSIDGVQPFAHTTWFDGKPHQVGTGREISERAAGDLAPANRFFRVGTSFLDAVRAASTETLRTTTGRGVRPGSSTAVLQADDGVYWITTLGYYLNGVSRGITIDSAQNVERLVDSVKAVVGARTWVNFTDEKIDFAPGA